MKISYSRLKEYPNQKGFTLIEVVLVLAIGGLIFLLAFLAFRQVSRNRRDSARRSDAASVIAELQNYKYDTRNFPSTNTAAFVSGNASTPTDVGDFVVKYLGAANFKDPSGNVYIWYGSDTSDAVFSTLTVPQPIFGINFHPIQYALDSKCNVGGGFTSSTGNIAVKVKLESGIACRDDA